MKEQLHEQLSALVDNELDDREQGLLYKQLGANAELSSQLSRYQLISDALQNKLPAKLDAGFSRRVQAALPDDLPAQSGRVRIASLLKPAAGLAVAASVAMVAVLSLQLVRNPETDTVQAVAAIPAKGSYIRATGGETSESVNTAEVSENLEIYLVNHSEYAPSRGMLPYVRLVGHDMNTDSRE